MAIDHHISSIVEQIRFLKSSIDFTNRLSWEQWSKNGDKKQFKEIRKQLGKYERELKIKTMILRNAWLQRGRASA